MDRRLSRYTVQMDLYGVGSLLFLGLLCAAMGIGSVVFVAVAWWVLQRASRQQEAFRRCIAVAAAELGLEAVSETLTQGTVDGVPVVIDTHWIDRGNRRIQLKRIRATGGPPGVSIDGPFDEATRAAVRAAVVHGAHYAEGAFTLHLYDPVFDPARMTMLIRSLAGATRALTESQRAP